MVALVSCGTQYPELQYQYASKHSNPKAALEAVQQISVAKFPQLDVSNIVLVDAAWADLTPVSPKNEEHCGYYIKYRIEDSDPSISVFLNELHPEQLGSVQRKGSPQDLFPLAGKSPQVVVILDNLTVLYYAENFDPPEIVYSMVVPGTLPPILQP